jgi:hypothetical protein
MASTEPWVSAFTTTLEDLVILLVDTIEDVIEGARAAGCDFGLSGLQVSFLGNIAGELSRW